MKVTIDTDCAEKTLENPLWLLIEGNAGALTLEVFDSHREEVIAFSDNLTPREAASCVLALRRGGFLHLSESTVARVAKERGVYHDGAREQLDRETAQWLAEGKLALIAYEGGILPKFAGEAGRKVFECLTLMGLCVPTEMKWGTQYSRFL